MSGVLSGFNSTLFIYVLLLFSIVIISDDLKLKSDVKKRRLQIQMEFPDFVNKLTLLLNAGLPMSKAWEKISIDYDGKGYFYSEVFKTVCDIKSGKNETEAYGEFAKRAKTAEISRLMSTLVQNTKRGGNGLVLSLRLQSNECWEMRKNAVRKLGEEASTKLLFPMMIMFLAVIIIVITPAIISMQAI
jgi:tight adherence protein C